MAWSSAMPPAEGTGGLGVSEFVLPDDMLAVLPQDPYEQLDLARRITALAVADRVTGLKREVARLREGTTDRDRENVELRDRVALLDRALQETNARLDAALEDNIQPSKEWDSLVQTSKKQARDLHKVESFKRYLMQSLRDDSTSPQETVDITTCDQSVSSKTSSCGDGSINHTAANLLNGSGDLGSTTREGLLSFLLIVYFGLPRFTVAALPRRRLSILHGDAGRAAKVHHAGGLCCSELLPVCSCSTRGTS